MNGSFEVHSLQFIVCIIISKFQEYLQYKNILRNNNIPDINGFVARIKIIDHKKMTVSVKVEPANWPKNVQLSINLAGTGNNWLPQQLSFNYPTIIDRVINFNISSSPLYTFTPIGDNDEIINKYYKPELIN